MPLLHPLTRFALLAAVCAASLAAQAAATRLKATTRGEQTYNCPFTGKPPVKATRKTRCIEAEEMTCCTDCTDVRNAMALVSARFMEVIQLVGPNNNTWPVYKKTTGGGRDELLCTTFARAGTAGTPYMNQECQNMLEQLGCAMTCNPDMGKYVRLKDDGSGYALKVCESFFVNLVMYCQSLKVPDGDARLAGFLGLQLEMIQDLGAVVSGLLKLPPLSVNTTTDTDKDPNCYALSPSVLGSISEPACCDPLSIKRCPPGSIDFDANPDWKQLVEDEEAPDFCREGKSFAAAPLTPLSPPPPIMEVPSPPPPPPPPADHGGSLPAAACCGLPPASSSSASRDHSAAGQRCRRPCASWAAAGAGSCFQCCANV